jgi:transposase
MLTFHLKLSSKQKVQLQEQLKIAQTKGDIAETKRILALLALATGQTPRNIATLLQISVETIRQNLNKYFLGGLNAVKSKRSPGRPSKLGKSQRKQLAAWIENGPEALGFPGSCWRTPMLQHLIYEKFGVFYNAHYLSALLKNMGFSYQKAAFVACKRNEQAREDWLKIHWPDIMTLAQQNNSYVLFGDEASFPQWGSLTYTWAPIGKQPIVQTSGTRKAYKVFGLIDYFTGRFFSKGHEGRFNSDSYIDFLQTILSQTRKHIILIQDGAPYHKGKKVKAFFEKHRARLSVYNLPSYSPDYNPIEKLWKKIKEKGIHLKYFPTFDDLQNKVNEMLNIFDDARNEVLPLFGFYNKL